MLQYLLPLLLSLSFSGCFNLTLGPNGICGFFETLKKDQRFGISVEVMGTSKELGLVIRDPINNIVYHKDGTGFRSIAFNARFDGKYSYTFINPNATELKLAFNTAEPFYPSEEEGPIRNSQEFLNRALTDVKLNLFGITKEQENFYQRVKIHLDIANSTANRVIMLGVFHILLLVGTSIWQIAHIRRFFEAKRIV